MILIILKTEGCVKLALPLRNLPERLLAQGALDPLSELIHEFVG